MIRTAVPARSGDADAVHGLPPRVFACGFSWRKRPLVRRFIGDVKVRFIRQGKEAEPGSTLLLWGSMPAPADLASDVRIVRLEDGFLRSVGLGADLIQPVSWVIDRRGVYYDATRPSDLESLLQTAEFSPELLERAGRLHKSIVENGLTKYNVGHGSWRRPEAGQRVILVPGQVETDASIRFGAPGIGTNGDLLQAVREAGPDAYVVYKPHPDVVAGLRAEGRGEAGARRWCDEVVTDVPMSELLSAVDEVHVLTSLAGFEALLRGRKVTCYGQPFYAGWGLTKDMVPPVSRRTRRLSLSMLVAGALILYPTYASRTTGRVITPEEAVGELVAWRETGAAGLSWRRRAYRYIVRRIVSRP